jgi:guanosine-3',5'-bis(diphosphate) 3'-pyrophosphohydrolase
VSWSSEGYVRALQLAAHWHRDQKVPGTELPYLVHVTSVCAEVQRALAEEATPQPDVAVQGALLHDILEDTPMSFDALSAEVGGAVAAVVAALSKDPALPKAEQMADSLRRIQLQPREASVIKLADRITNLSAPPSYWTRAKCAAYRAEAEQILAALGPASPFLAARLRQRIEAYAAFV